MTALGDRSDATTMWRSEFSESSSLLRMAELHKRAFPWTARQTPMKVNVERLDAFRTRLHLKPRVLLKIDVQGYERQVIDGADQTLEQVDYVLVEVSFGALYEGQSSFHDIYEQLVPRGFMFAGILDQLDSPVDSTPLQADALFMRA
jgi:hypothetical protein